MDDQVKHTKVLGDRSTAYVLARLLEVYDTVLLPFGENMRYDLLAEDADGRFLRIQCKTGRLRGGAIWFPSCSTTYHHPNGPDRDYRRHDYRGQADFFGIYCPETEAAYLVPVEEVGRVMGSLRVDVPRNNQSRKIRWAVDYELRGTRSNWRTSRTRGNQKPEQSSLLREPAITYGTVLAGIAQG
jgi:hypothetical protein